MKRQSLKIEFEIKLSGGL